MSDNSLPLIFGTETGNAEELAEDAANMANGVGITQGERDRKDMVYT